MLRMEDKKIMVKDAHRLSNVFLDRELSHLLAPIRITMKKSLPKIEVLSFTLEDTKEGDIHELPRWAAEVLVEMGFAEAEDESFELEVFKALSRERIQGPTQLSTLKDDFYLKLRRLLKGLRAKAEKDGSIKPELDRLLISVYDLITLRIGKLLYLAGSSYPQGISEKVTPEEKELFDQVRKSVEEWRNFLVEGEAL